MDVREFTDAFLQGAWLMRQAPWGYAPLCERSWQHHCHDRCRGCDRYLEPQNRLPLARLHLEKRITIGASPLREGQVRWGCLDVDRGGLSLEAQRQLVHILRAEVRHFFPEVLTEFSGKKGYHLWLLFDRFLPAGPVQGLLRHVVRKVAAESGLDTSVVEVFPKQLQGRGNVVKLPLSIHRASGRGCPFLDDGWQPVSLQSLPLVSGAAFLELAESEGWQSLEAQAYHRCQPIELPLIPGDPRLLYRKCAAIRQVWRQQARNAGRVSYDTWFRWIVLPLAHFESGEVLIHEISSAYAGYDVEDTQRTIEDVRRRSYGPPACLQPGQLLCPAGRRPEECGLRPFGRSPSPLRFALLDPAPRCA